LHFRRGAWHQDVNSWAQELEAGRAPVVRAALERGRVPVMLVPVHVAVPVA
jgi:hypothetical protein